MKRTFDRKVEFDPRSKLFPITATLDKTTFRSYTWPCDTFNDQFTEGACVGFALGHELAAVPIRYKTDNELCRFIYKRAQQLDQWEGEAYEGTSVLAGIKAVQEMKNVKGEPLISEYRWAFGIEDLARAVGRKGPAVLGINWYSGMFDIDADGYIHKTGYLAGGHAILCRGVRVRYVKPGNKSDFMNVDMYKSYFILHNSWGQSWGRNGTCKISFLDMDALLKEWGEAVIPIQRNR